jgi:hypothetical protein
MKYRIQITETLQKTIEVESGTEVEALQQVVNDYKRERIILDSDDFKEVDISPIKQEEVKEPDI